MNTKEQLRENILETNYFLTQALMRDNIEDVEKFRAQLNELISKYKQFTNE